MQNFSKDLSLVDLTREPHALTVHPAHLEIDKPQLFVWRCLAYPEISSTPVFLPVYKYITSYIAPSTAETYCRGMDAV